MRERVGAARRIYRKILYRDIDKVYAKHFDQRQMERKKKKVLDVGMGFGFDLITKFRNGYDCFGIDYDKYRVDKTRKMFEKHGLNAVLKVGSATKIPFGKNIFDEVICSHVIEHVADDEKCLTEMNRVLKRGGVLYLRVPNIHNLHTKFHLKVGSRTPYTDRTHLREYDKNNLANLLRKTGFKIISIRPSGFFLPFGLKLFMIASHYLPWGELMEYLGEKFPRNAAEIKVVAKK